MSWNCGSPMLVLGVRVLDFEGEDKKQVQYSEVTVIDGSKPDNGKGLGLRAQVAKCDRMDITPGWYMGVLSVSARSGGGVRTGVELTARLGNGPELAPPMQTLAASPEAPAAESGASANGRRTPAAV